MRQRQEVSVSQRGQSCSVFSGGSVGQSGLVLDGLRMFIWPIWPICAFWLCLWNQQAAVSSLRGALGTATIVMTETIGGRYQGGRRYNLELFGSCIVFYHILSKYVTIVLLYQWLETMFERTFCGNDVWILSPPATSLDESWKGDDGDDHLSHLDWWSPVGCHVAEKPSFSHCVFIVPVCRLKTDCQRAPMLPMIRGYQGFFSKSHNSAVETRQYTVHIDAKEKEAFLWWWQLSSSVKQSHEPTMTGVNYYPLVMTNIANWKITIF